MAIIQSGASADLLTVDPTSKASRVTLYNSAGVEQNAAPLGSYIAPVNITFAGVVAANSAIWSLRAGASRFIRLRRMNLHLVANPVTSVASTMLYEFIRFGTATPTGGTSITPSKKRTTFATSTIADARQGTTALSVTGVVFDTAGSSLVVGNPRHVGGALFVSTFFTDADEPFVLGPNEGLAIRVLNATISGDGLYGHIQWDETTA